MPGSRFGSKTGKTNDQLNRKAQRCQTAESMSDPKRIRELIDAIEAERLRGLFIRRSLTGAILLSVLALFGNLYHQIHSFDTDRTLKEVERLVSLRVVPHYTRSFQKLGQQAVPAITDAFSQEAERLLPRVSDRLQTEAATLQVNISIYMGNALDREFLNAAKSKEDELKESFPSFVADAEAYEELMRRMQRAAQLWAQDELDTTFGEHVLILESINQTVQALQDQSAKEREKTGDRSMEDVLVILSEILNTRVAERD